MSDEPQNSETPDAGEPAAEPSKALRISTTLTADPSGVQAIIPRDLDQVAKLARGIIESGIVPDAFTHQKDVFEHGTGNVIFRKGDPNRPLIIMGILKSLEVGLPPLTGLANLLPINNRFTIWGDAAIALAQSKGLVAKFTDRKNGTLEPGLELADWPLDYGHAVSIWRRNQDEPYIGRYTVADARRAGLWMDTRRTPWIKSPDRMLFNRARAFAIRDGFADALMGLGIVEEVRDHIEPVDQGEVEKRHRSALDDEPEETPALPHEQAIDADFEPELAKQAEKIMQDKDF